MKSNYSEMRTVCILNFNVTNALPFFKKEEENCYPKAKKTILFLLTYFFKEFYHVCAFFVHFV